jgi:hypothetical protein
MNNDVRTGDHRYQMGTNIGAITFADAVNYIYVMPYCCLATARQLHYFLTVAWQQSARHIITM